MKINLDKLRKQGWHVNQDTSEIELFPPAMNGEDHARIINALRNHVTTPMGLDLVSAALFDAMGKAALLEMME